MDVKMMRIAEKKVRQLGGDVCGVLVRTEAGAWAAVSEGGRVMWLDDFEPVPAARNEDVALPSHATKSDLIDCIDLMADEFKRIKALNPSDEISGLCDRALQVTEQNVPVLEIRDRLQKTVSKLLWQVSDLEDQLKAARAQGGRGAEVVAKVDHGCNREIRWLMSEDELEKLPQGMSLYTQPQPAQQGSVPEDVIRQCEDAIQYASEIRGGCISGVREAQKRVRAILSTFQPEGDGWIECSERLPTEADDDFNGCVWARFEDGDIELMEAEEVEQTWGDDISITHWKPTGLKRPQPPKDDA